jgi:hypothetical protein
MDEDVEKIVDKIIADSPTSPIHFPLIHPDGEEDIPAFDAKTLRAIKDIREVFGGTSPKVDLFNVKQDITLIPAKDVEKIVDKIIADAATELLDVQPVSDELKKMGHVIDKIKGGYSMGDDVGDVKHVHKGYSGASGFSGYREAPEESFSGFEDKEMEKIRKETLTLTDWASLDAVRPGGIESALRRYERDVNSIAHVISRQGEVKKEASFADESLDRLIDSYRRQISTMEKALSSSPDFRDAVAKSMAEPIRGSLEYKSIEQTLSSVNALLSVDGDLTYNRTEGDSKDCTEEDEHLENMIRLTKMGTDDRPATKEEIADMQANLGAVATDPNLTIGSGQIHYFFATQGQWVGDVSSIPDSIPYDETAPNESSIDAAFRRLQSEQKDA